MHKKKLECSKETHKNRQSKHATAKGNVR